MFSILIRVLFSIFVSALIKATHGEDEIIDLTWPVKENRTLGWPGFKTPFDLHNVVKGDPYGINSW